MKKKLKFSGAALLALALSSGCSIIAPDARIPVPVDPAQDHRRSDTLIVMLPGRRSGEGDFREKGFFDLAREHGLDAISVDGHMGYYLNRTITTRLHEDVVLPAQAQGYTRIWLLGISLGGFGAILYTDEHPDGVDGMILLAPYLGDEKISEEIRDNGGLRTWNRHSDAGKEHERRAWRRLQTEIDNPDGAKVVLGYGTDDRFADANSVVAEALPGPQVFTVEGGHNWSAWKPLWNDILDAGFPRRIDPAATD